MGQDLEEPFAMDLPGCTDGELGCLVVFHPAEVAWPAVLRAHRALGNATGGSIASDAPSPLETFERIGEVVDVSFAVGAAQGQS